MKNFKRILAAIFGAVLFGIVVPLAYFLLFDRFPIEGIKGVALLIGAGVTAGAILGALFPRVFGFVFETFFDI